VIFRCKLQTLSHHFGISSQPPNPKDEGLHVVPENHQDRIIYSAVTPIESRPIDAPDEEEPPHFFTFGRIMLFIGIVFALMLLAFGIIYRMESRRFPVVVTVGMPEQKAQPEDVPVDKTKSLVPVSPDMLHVTSIALGETPLTIVNGKRLGEGDALAIATPLGTATVRVTLIQDGLVRFRHGGETIDIKMEALHSIPAASPH
jgi:hypothetical protein